MMAVRQRASWKDESRRSLNETWKASGSFRGQRLLAERSMMAELRGYRSGVTGELSW